MAQNCTGNMNTDNSTETRAQTSLCHTICICYISVIPTVFDSLLHALKPFLVSQAVWGSVMSCATILAAEEMMSTDTHTHSNMPFPQNPHATQLVSLKDKSAYHFTKHYPVHFSRPLWSSFDCPPTRLSSYLSDIRPLFPSPCHSQNFLISSRLMRLRGRVALWGRGSRYDILLLATNGCNSGRKPGLNL